MRRYLLLLLLLPMCAEAIEKCVTPDGRTMYSDTPCPSDAKRVGAIEAAPPPDPETVERARAERESLQREVERIERKDAARSEANARAAAADREEARRREQDALQQRQTEALERLAAEQNRQPVYLGPPLYGTARPHPRPPIVQPKPHVKPVEEETKRYDAAPFPRKKAQ